MMCQSEAIATSTELTHERINDKLIKKGCHMGNGKNDNPFYPCLFLLYGRSSHFWYEIVIVSYQNDDIFLKNLLLMMPSIGMYIYE